MVRFIIKTSILLAIILICVNSIFLYSEIKNLPVYVDKEFREIYREFVKDSIRYNSSLDLRTHIIYFSNNIEGSTAAYCIPAINMVVVSSKFWKKSSLKTRKALLYHEWGHCLLKRPHTADRFPFFSLGVAGCPISIMYPYIDSIMLCYNNYENWYIAELFTNPLKYKKFRRR